MTFIPERFDYKHLSKEALDMMPQHFTTRDYTSKLRELNCAQEYLKNRTYYKYLRKNCFKGITKQSWRKKSKKHSAIADPIDIYSLYENNASAFVANLYSYLKAYNCKKIIDDCTKYLAENGYKVVLESDNANSVKLSDLERIEESIVFLMDNDYAVVKNNHLINLQFDDALTIVKTAGCKVTREKIIAETIIEEL